MKGKIRKLKDSNGEYILPITSSRSVYVDSNKNLESKLKEIDSMGLDWLSDVDVNTINPQDNDFLVFKNSKWQPHKLGLGTYVVELNRWSIRNDGSDPVNTSTGINLALYWASEQGYTELLLIPGLYLIDENNPIIIPSHMTLNLGGATLKIRPNSLPSYTIIKFQGEDTQFCRVTNGKLEGDRYEHNYVSGNIHEGGTGILIDQGRYISIDNLDVFNFTGDCIKISTNPGWRSGNLTAWEKGDINLSNGNLLDSTDTIRLKNRIDLSESRYKDIREKGWFSIVGNSWGDFGSEVHSSLIDVSFYDHNGQYISSVANVNYFDKVLVPEGAIYLNLVMHQASLPTGTGDSVVIQIAKPRYAEHIYIEKCELHHSRRTAIAGAGRHVYILNSEIYNISGVPPQIAIDIEDGYGLNQYYVISGNNIHDCKLGLGFVSTRNVLLCNNRLDRLGPSTVWNECVGVVIKGNQIKRSGWSLRGDTIFSDNTLYGSSLELRDKTSSIVSGNLLHNSTIKIDKIKPFSAIVDSCHFYHDSDSPTMKGQNAGFFYDTQPQTVSNCIFEGYGSNSFFLGSSNASGWRFINNTFKNTSKGVSLPPGEIRNCHFDNAGLNLSGTNKGYYYEFSNCTFKNWTNSIFQAGYDGNLHLHVKDCKFLEGGDVPVAFFRNVTGNIEFIGNIFEFPNSTTARLNIIDFQTSNRDFNAKRILIDGNRFTSNMSLTAVNLYRNNNTEIFFRDNILENVVQEIVSDHVLTSNNYINGIYEPYKKVNTPPFVGKYNAGDIVYNAKPNPGGYIGWVCTTSGYACGNKWGEQIYYNFGDRVAENGHVYETIYPGPKGSSKPNFDATSGPQVYETPLPPKWFAQTTYSIGDRIIPSIFKGFYYECTMAGTSGIIEPTFPDRTGSTISDGTVTWRAATLLTWKEIGHEAVFKPYGLISG